MTLPNGPLTPGLSRLLSMRCKHWREITRVEREYQNYAALIAES
jgi:hypothetical protein